MILLLKRYRGHTIKVVRNNYGPGSREYEWRIRGPVTLNDPTSWMRKQFVVSEVKIEVDELLPVHPRRFVKRRRNIKLLPSIK